MQYEINEVKLSEKSEKRIREQLGDGYQISAVFGFNPSYVMERSSPDFSGVLVLTGPVLEYQIFRNVGLKLVHAGALKTMDNTVELSKENYDAFRDLNISDKVNGMLTAVKEIHPHILAYFKAEELKGG